MKRSLPFNIIILYLFIASSYSMHNNTDQNEFAHYMIAKWKNKKLSSFEPFDLQKQDWLNDKNNIDALKYLPLREKTYLKNSKLYDFIIKSCNQNPHEAQELLVRFTHYQKHLSQRLPELQKQKLITSEEIQNITHFVASVQDILRTGLSWNNGPFMEGIINAFWEKEPDIMKLEPFTINEYHYLSYDLDSIHVLLNRNKRYMSNRIIRNYLIKRCKDQPVKTQILQQFFLEYQKKMHDRLKELISQNKIDQQDATHIKEYISRVLEVCNTALAQPSNICSIILQKFGWKTLTLFSIVSIGIIYYYHKKASPQETASS